MRTIVVSQNNYKMKTTDAFTQGQSLITTILGKMSNLNEWKRRFLLESFMLFLTIRGRVNFLQMGRYGRYDESTYRNGFENKFDFLDFNSKLIKGHCSDDMILGFDPTFISKSGKCTPGLGYYYSGTEGRYKRGLEVGCIAAIDVSQNTAYHLEGVQSPAARKSDLSDGRSIVDHYAELIISRAPELKQISQILVCDGYFAKRRFIDPIDTSTELSLISRLRDDANLRYLYLGKQKPGKGRPQRYDGKINVKQIDKRRISKVYEDDQIRIYSAIVNSVGLKRDIKLAYVEFLDPKGKLITTKLFFSTDLEMSGLKILKYYQARFQMEFIFRDAKQFTSLQHCQARSSNKLHFHINASLTSTSIAKCIQRKGISVDNPSRTSISDVKTELFNHYLLHRIFSIFQIRQNINKNDNMYGKILDIGKIAA